MNKKKIKLLLGVIAVIGGLFIIGEGWSIFDIEYHFFGKKRTAEMEEMYGIEVTDDIHLKEYREFGWLSFQYDLEIDKINSYTDFLQNNVKGSDIHVFDDRNHRKYYIYTWHNTEVYIDFFPQSDNTYMAVLSICE